MSEPKEQKIRIYNFAAQFNVSAQAIFDFLKKKGYDVKTMNSLLSPEMLEDVRVQFKKDIERAEKHYQKLDEFNKKLAGTPEKTEQKEEVAEIPVPAPQPVVVEEPKVVEPEVVPQVEAVITEVIPEPVVEKPAEPVVVPPVQREIRQEFTEIKRKETPPTAVVTEPVEEKVSAEIEALIKPDEPVTPEPTTVEAVDKDQPQHTPRKIDPRTGKPIGLKILGRFRGDDPKPPREELRSGVTLVTPTEVKPATTTDSEEEDKKKSKKKKKKPKSKKRESVVEETEAVKKKAKVKKLEIDQKEVLESIRKTMLNTDESSISNRASMRKRKRRERLEAQELLDEQRRIDERKIRVNQFMSVSELANVMGVGVGEVISKCIALGLMVSINQRIELDTITLVADEFDYEVEVEDEYTNDVLEDIDDLDDELEPRSPVVTIMGHVDHGKTSLLDYVRSSNVVAGESGGITQHIGAYKVLVNEDNYITFLDTPGHEAFTAMRARGAQVTDIVILIVAADDAVMPQTVEAISHAQAANVPIIVAINKIDKPGANIEKIKQQLADRNVLVEEWGGRYQCVEISAKKGLHIEDLLEKVLLEAEVLDLKANPHREARGVVIESQLDKGRGVTATVLIQKGTLKQGDIFVCGNQHGRVRAMFDERNKKMDEAPPSSPVLVLGFEGAPQAGDQFIVVDSERTAREIALKRQQLKRELDSKQIHHITLDEISRQIQIGGVSELPIIVKGDVDGSVEAVSDSLMKLSTEEVKVKVIHKGVGAISESDVLLANASNAIIIGFHVRPHMNARKLAETQKVDIRIYNIIYDAISEVKLALEGMLAPILSEEVTSSTEIRDTFKVPKIGTVAGCYVIEGKINRNDRIRVIRDGLVIFTGEISSLKRFKDDVKEVDTNYECGISVNNFNDLKVGDIIEGFKVVETKKKLE
ncbi:MAG: translation initiation factor IF-2 [Ignavibacteriaceae bacterium]|jgi:translation initiation factor IF-2|nr:translation initiation factor IF-2 [Ignavibacteriaceae bacterium]MCC6637717.1 translation initiation factor IF-2 [Ignavibacteriaceae bacterium]